MKHVLLLEPDIQLAGTYQRYLSSLGYTVTTTSNAQDAIERIDSKCPDVVVLELQLPGHNGVEFLHELRSYVEWQSIPVIIHSLLPLRLLEKYQDNWRAFGVSNVRSKTTTSLEALGKLVQTAGT